MVVKRGREHEVEDIFEKWDLHAVRIGDVRAESTLRREGARAARGADPESRADR